MKARRVLLAGEGKTELGDWAGEPTYRPQPPLPGVLQALLSKVAPEGWEVAAALEWKQLRRYRANQPGLEKDELNTHALWLRALDHGCDLIVFSRDRDRAEKRAEAVARGLGRLKHDCTRRGIHVVGGMSVECIEAWVLALGGMTRSEELSTGRAKQMLHESGVANTADMVAKVAVADLKQLPQDARSLHAWIAQAEAALAP